MKVCHMTSAHKNHDTRIFYKECTSLARNGYETYLVVQGDSFEENGVHVVGVGEPPASRLKRMTQTSKKVYRTALGLDCDIYHFHDPELLPYGLKLKRKGKKVIYDSHEDVPKQIMEKGWIPAPLRRMIAAVMAKYEKHVVKRLDAVVTVSPHIVERFRSYSVKTEMICNFPILNETEQVSDWSQKENAVCFAGGISSQWMHETVLSALPELPQTRYILAGVGDDSYLDKLRAMPGWQQVEFCGKIPHEEVGTLYHRSIAGVALNDYVANVGYKQGSMGNTKLFEYMQSGLPVIGTDFVLWKQIIEGAHCGICINPHNAQEFAEAVSYLLNHREEAEQMGKNGMQAVRKRYHWGLEEEKLVSLYKDISA